MKRIVMMAAMVALAGCGSPCVPPAATGPTALEQRVCDMVAEADAARAEYNSNAANVGYPTPQELAALVADQRVVSKARIIDRLGISIREYDAALRKCGHSEQ